MLTGSDYRDRFIALRGGLIVPAEALMLLLELEARGFKLTPDNGDIIVQPFSQLTPEDCWQIRRWKLHLLALLDYEAPCVS